MKNFKSIVMILSLCLTMFSTQVVQAKEGGTSSGGGGNKALIIPTSDGIAISCSGRVFQCSQYPEVCSEIISTSGKHSIVSKLKQFCDASVLPEENNNY